MILFRSSGRSEWALSGNSPILSLPISASPTVHTPLPPYCSQHVGIRVVDGRRGEAGGGARDALQGCQQPRQGRAPRGPGQLGRGTVLLLYPFPSPVLLVSPFPQCPGGQIPAQIRGALPWGCTLRGRVGRGCCSSRGVGTPWNWLVLRPVVLLPAEFRMRDQTGFAMEALGLLSKSQGVPDQCSDDLIRVCSVPCIQF